MLAGLFCAEGLENGVLIAVNGLVSGSLGSVLGKFRDGRNNSHPPRTRPTELPQTLPTPHTKEQPVRTQANFADKVLQLIPDLFSGPVVVGWENGDGKFRREVHWILRR